MKKEAQAFAKKYGSLSEAMKACHVIKDGLGKLMAEKGGCALYVWLESECRNIQKMDKPITNSQALSLLEEFDKKAIREIFESMENTRQLTKKYVSAILTFKSWIRMRKSSNPNFGVKPTEQNYTPTL